MDDFITGEIGAWKKYVVAHGSLEQGDRHQILRYFKGIRKLYIYTHT